MTTTISRDDQTRSDSQKSSVVSGSHSRVDQTPCDDQDDAVDAGPYFLAGHITGDTHGLTASEESLPRDGHTASDTHVAGAVSGSSLRVDQRGDDSQSSIVTAEPSNSPDLDQPRIFPALEVPGSAGHTEQLNDQAASGTQTSGAVKSSPQMTSDDQCQFDTQTVRVVAPTPTGVAAIASADQAVPVGPSTSPALARSPSLPNHAAPELADPLLALAADVLDDLERVRIANENRLRQLTRDETDKDGEERGFGLTLDHPDVARLAALVEALSKAEHDATLNLQRMVRRHPIGPWIKKAKGIGEKQGARLLAAVGDPYWNNLHQRPRTVSELWAYTGYHVLKLPGGQRVADIHRSSAVGGPISTDQSAQTSPAGSDPDQTRSDTQTMSVGVAAVQIRGRRANWSPTAKMRTRLISESIVKAGGPYREVYDAGRMKYAEALHQVECRRCGPAGRPAQVGSALSDGHKHARALRLVSKAVLKDLWREAKRLHEDHT